MPVKTKGPARGRNVSRARIRRTLVTIAAISAGVSATAVVAHAFSTPGRPEAFHMSDRPIATSIQTDQANGFAVLARPRTARDEMPPEAQAQVGNSTKSGRNLALSRAIATPNGTGWAVPGNRAVCIVTPDPVDGYGVGCTDTSFALTHGLLDITISSRTPRLADITIVLPRNSTASAALADGQIKPLQADQDGVISVTLVDTRSLSIRTPQGVQQIDMPVPPPIRPTQKDCGDGQVIDVTANCS